MGEWGCLGGVLEALGDAKVADFDCALFAQEDILRFQVAMQNVEAVDIMDGVDHLIQKAHDRRLGQQR
jgi:hypothetical protein